MIRSPLEITLEKTGSTWIEGWTGDSDCIVEFDGKRYHSTERYARLERGIAKLLRVGMVRSLRDIRYQQGDLTNCQYGALSSVCQSYYSVLLGPPGTGKTTILRKACEAPGTVLLATTGAAAVRVGADACSTVHRALGFNGERFTRTIDGASRIFVDECSMLDEQVLYALLRCKSPITFVGDINQLPSVQPGKVLADLSETIPTAKLTELLRYEPDSDIGRACNSIINGDFPIAGGSFLIDESEDLAGISVAAMELSFKARTTAYDMLVMCRTNAERESANAEFGLCYPYPVMNVVNRYRGTGENRVLALANGEKGMATKAAVSVFVREGVRKYYRTDENIVPAWVCTVNKVQGHQSRACIVGMGSSLRWDRRLFYTAVSRSQKYCIVYGSPTAIAAAVANPGASSRVTLISNFYFYKECK